MNTILRRTILVAIAVFVACTTPAFTTFGPATQARDASPTSRFAFIDSAAKTFGFERSIDPNPLLVVPDPAISSSYPDVFTARLCPRIRLQPSGG